MIDSGYGDNELFKKAMDELNRRHPERKGKHPMGEVKALMQGMVGNG